MDIFRKNIEQISKKYRYFSQKISIDIFRKNIEQISIKNRYFPQKISIDIVRKNIEHISKKYRYHENLLSQKRDMKYNKKKILKVVTYAIKSKSLITLNLTNHEAAT